MAKKGTYQIYLMPQAFDEENFTVQVLYVDASGKELPAFWTQFPVEVAKNEKQLSDLIEQGFQKHELDLGEVEVHFVEEEFPPKSAHFPKHVKRWKPQSCRTSKETRYDLEIFIPLDPEAVESFLPREEAQHSLRDLEWEQMKRALHAGVDFEIFFGYFSSGAGTGFGYRDLEYSRLTKEEVDRLRPEAERILTGMGYRLGTGRMRARVEVNSQPCEED